MQTSAKEQNQNEHCLSEHCLVVSTCPDQQSAELIAKALVEEKLAACVNIIPGLTSIYQWQGNIEKSSELLLIIKTKPGAWSRIKSAIINRHPYELPEIISIPITHGLPGYLSWIDENVVSN